MYTGFVVGFTIFSLWLVEIGVLCLQLSSLASENKILVVKLKQTNKYPEEVSVALTTDHKVGTSYFINLCFYFLHMVDVQESPEQVNL